MKELLAKHGIKVKNGQIARSDFNKALKVVSCNMESLMLDSKKLDEEFADSIVPLKEKDFYAKAAVIEKNGKVRFESIGGGFEVYASSSSIGDKLTIIGLNGFGSGSVDYVGDSSLQAIWPVGDLEKLKNDIVYELHQIYNEADKKVSKIMLAYNLKRK